MPEGGGCGFSGWLACLAVNGTEESASAEQQRWQHGCYWAWGAPTSCGSRFSRCAVRRHTSWGCRTWPRTGARRRRRQRWLTGRLLALQGLRRCVVLQRSVQLWTVLSHGLAGKTGGWRRRRRLRTCRRWRRSWPVWAAALSHHEAAPGARGSSAACREGQKDRGTRAAAGGKGRGLWCGSGDGGGRSGRERRHGG